MRATNSRHDKPQKGRGRQPKEATFEVTIIFGERQRRAFEWFQKNHFSEGTNLAGDLCRGLG